MSVKAFEPLQVSKFLNIPKIECIEASGNDVYFGCNNGLIIHTSIEERRDHESNVVYSSNIVCQRNIGTKKKIHVIKAASALGRLLVLSDSNLYLLDADVLATIGSGSKMKNILSLCVNENPSSLDPFTLEFCVGKKKTLLLCSLHEEKIITLREIAIQDLPVNIAMDGKFICMAGELQYSILDIQTAASLDLFPVDPSIHNPHIKRISKEEFLIMGPGNLGIFVTAAGTSERPPIQWGNEIIGFTYYHPYILTLTDRYIHVYSLIDQKNKQTILFNAGSLIGNFDGQIYVTTESSLHCLMPQPWSSQVMTLLENESIDEALELTEHSGGAGMTSERYIEFTMDVLRRAGFIRFANGIFEEAQDFFIKGKLDVRELLCLFPGLLSSKTDFTRAQPPLHSLANIHQAFNGDLNKINEAKSFLKDFFNHLRTLPEAAFQKMEIESALLKLYSEEGGQQLIQFIESSQFSGFVEESVQILQSRNQNVALAKLYKSLGDYDKSLDILTKLSRSELTDDAFEGAKEIVDVILSSCKEDLVWSYSDFLLNADQGEAVRLFCQFKADLDPVLVLKRLSRFPMSRIDYLHYIIYQKDIGDEKYHTELVLHYIAQTLKCTKESDQMSEVQKKLRDLLESSDQYNPRAALANLKDTGLYYETATVYGKMGEHEKALSIFVFDLNDFSSAERYCQNQTENLLEENKSFIYTTLLKLYLKPSSRGGADDINLGPALNLLSVHASCFDLRSVLQILPSEWSVRIAQNYIKGAIRSSLHRNQMKKMEQSLISVVNVQQKFVHQNLCKVVGPIALSSSSVCCVCSRGFKSSVFSLYSNGVLCHKECIRDPSVCPLTGKIFRVI